MIVDLWNYVWEALRTHPFNFLTLALALLAGAISIVAARYSRRQTRAAEAQATEARLAREASERSIDLQARALESQAAALLSQAADTATALALAGRNAAAAEESSRTAAQGVAQAKESLQRTLRPYVTVDQIAAKDVLACRTEDDPLCLLNVPQEVKITVINTGQTPARHLEILIHVAVLHEIPQSFAEHAQHFRGWMPTDIGKDQTREVYGRFFGKNEILEQVAKDPLSRFTVYGAIRYRDMFSDDEHVTEYCFVWDVRLQQFFPVGPMNSIT